MQLVLEHEDIDRLLRLGLAAEGIRVPEGCDLHLRANHKKSTLRAVYRPAGKRAPTPPAPPKENR
jgi:hypothetical protein